VPEDGKVRLIELGDRIGRLSRDIDEVQRDMLSIISEQGAAAIYEALPGTAYSRYTLPIDYLPSRDYSPRWGYSRPAEPVMLDFFRAHAPRYRSFLERMREMAKRLTEVPLRFSEENLPYPLGPECPMLHSMLWPFAS
jgi:hypothetical protein